jgi:nicotinate-nucleotide pyrophosphorylase (carboxylating)
MNVEGTKVDSGLLDLIVRLALAEDLLPQDRMAAQRDLLESAFGTIDPSADVTSHAIFSNEKADTRANAGADARASALVVAKQKGILSGSGAFTHVYDIVDGEIDCFFEKKDGESFENKDTIVRLSGRACSILTGERTALNFLAHLSGVATETHRIASVLRNSTVTLLDTRKTLPGLRALEKEAVRHGGGENHRMGLYDMILIKDNHIDRSGSITEAVRRVRAAYSDQYKIEVETRTIAEVQEALAAGVDRIMLDNMPEHTVRRAARLAGDACELEVSGNITRKRIRRLRGLFVDYVSCGYITHSAPACDFSLLVETQG